MVFTPIALVHQSMTPDGCTSQLGRATVGHATHLRVSIDPDLLQWPEVWAAGSTWNDAFGIEQHTLVEVSGGARKPGRGSSRAATNGIRRHSPARQAGVDVEDFLSALDH